MSDYGQHPTIYGSLSDGKLYALYRWETWSGLDEVHREQLLQETVNRAAASNGENGSCRVVFDDLKEHVAGQQAGNTIRVNRAFYARDVRMTAKNGELVPEIRLSNGLEALTTVLHEDQHAYQNQIVDGTIPAPSPELRQEYASNNFATVLVTTPDGNTRWGSTYIQGNTKFYGYYLYYMQSTERDAHRFSEERAMEIMNQLEREYGTEPSFEAFRREIEANGYEATMEAAKELFANEQVEQEVNQSLINHTFGTDGEVSPEVESLVSEELASTYDELYQNKQSTELHHETENAAESGMMPFSGAAEPYGEQNAASADIPAWKVDAGAGVGNTAGENALDGGADLGSDSGGAEIGSDDGGIE